MKLLGLLHVVAAIAACTSLALFAADVTRSSWNFQFASDHVSSGFTPVPASAVYSKEAGFGFEPGAALVTAGAAVTSTQPFLFSVKVPEGNYRVTVTLGDPTADAITTVKAETRRLMLERVRTRAGEFVTRI